MENSLIKENSMFKIQVDINQLSRAEKSLEKIYLKI